MDILRVFFPEIFFFLLLLHLTLFSSEASGSRIKKRPRLLPNDANELDDFGQERLLPGNNLAAEEAVSFKSAFSNSHNSKIKSVIPNPTL